MIRTLTEKQVWNDWLKAMDDYDFYHTYEYHQLLDKNSNIPVLFAYEEGNQKIGIPFIKRKITEETYDLTSVHGYLGPVSKNVDSNFDNSKFLEAFQQWLEELGIVSVFSKLNPFIKHQEQILNGLGNIEEVSEVLFFDQTQNEDSQLKVYNRNTRQKIRQLRDVSYVKEATSEEEIEDFISLYHKSMDRLDAKKMFYFEPDYFTVLRESDMTKAQIFLSIHKESNDIMAGVFCTQTSSIAHIELACTNEDYFKSSPVRILFDECRKNYKGDTLKYLNLGGGSGGREGSLMRFKSSFTKNYSTLKVWKYISNQNKYDSLLSQAQRKSPSNFFPKYRQSTTS